MEKQFEYHELVYLNLINKVGKLASSMFNKEEIRNNIKDIVKEIVISASSSYILKDEYSVYIDKRIVIVMNRILININELIANNFYNLENQIINTIMQELSTIATLYNIDFNKLVKEIKTEIGNVDGQRNNHM